MKVKSLKELRKYIEKSIDNSLQNEVFEMVKKTQIKHIVTDVFNTYSPSIYERRNRLGIDDPDNIIYEPVRNGVLKVENVTKFNPGYETENHGLGVAKLIEQGHISSGYCYDYPSSKNFTDPRPFIANTKEEIRETKSHIKTIKLGLKRNKIKTL